VVLVANQRVDRRLQIRAAELEPCHNPADAFRDPGRLLLQRARTICPADFIENLAAKFELARLRQ
jgi:hypothetical protein